jgi:hypothetical protein
MFGQYEAISALGYGVIGNKQLRRVLGPTEGRGSLEWSLFASKRPRYAGDEAGEKMLKDPRYWKRVSHDGTGST